MRMATGIVRKVDELGRIVIPIELRRTLQIGLGDSLEVFTSEGEVILRKYSPGCTICGGLGKPMKEYAPFKRICTSCSKAIADDAFYRTDEKIITSAV
ncbi:hypothetical protein PM3016_5474 [Paenibacillus mucilaginosus 3016]|uniref:SpoVT-AbrB domain-containing protein n=1 Tax=Paenibacillus mucilaginosus 3016 TaxID=1116391 RepID=H6NG47_9BACL|nr:AbrB/MazE/SpoVT family DNA-binding domain-containing protein [Paenibacillus mucilaginosus]AFC32174.1 hypothetical protein PM3016_5474 [Paenibacillus mucilaginosus 3016]WFA20670.1 AbrB/MazE/SpoVT family DNA-binding domain-containing protein [Paenibacillus mucilaginosus]